MKIIESNDENLKFNLKLMKFLLVIFSISKYFYEKNFVLSAIILISGFLIWRENVWKRKSEEPEKVLKTEIKQK